MLRVAVVLVPLLIVTGVSLHGTPAGAQSPPAGTATAAPTSLPASPTSSPPASTPWPAPANLRVTTVARLLDEAGRPLPPAQQEHHDLLAWDHTPGSGGEYSIEVTLVPVGGGSATVFQPLMTFPADRGNGTIRRISQYPEWLNYQRCYRIRLTVPSVVGGAEVGPFGGAACTVKPPSSGPGSTPTAPDTGTGEAPRPARIWPIALGAVLAFGSGSAAVVWFGTHRRLRL